jgi:hypothetical protein
VIEVIEPGSTAETKEQFEITGGKLNELEAEFAKIVGSMARVHGAQEVAAGIVYFLLLNTSRETVDYLVRVIDDALKAQGN